MVRKYEQTLRAEKQEQTRRRIVEAAVELHGTLGPAATSLSAVAERAGVQRNTLYRHFPDTRSLLLACSGHYDALHPFPSAVGLVDIADPVARARSGLLSLYSYYEEVEPMMTRVLRDAESDEDVAEVSRLWTRQLAAMSEVLGAAWPRRGPYEQRAAAIDLALSFRTWQSLVSHSGLPSRTAADLMARTLDCVGNDT